MKRFLVLLSILCLLVVGVSAAQNRITDEADLLTAEEETELSQLADSIVQTHNKDVVILTVETTGYRSSSSFADSFYRDNGYGFGDEQSGVILLIAIEDRQWAIRTYGDGFTAVDNEDLIEIEDKIKPNLTDGDYYGACKAFLTAVEHEFVMADPHSMPNNLIRIGISLLGGAVVALIVLLVLRSRMNTAKPQHGAKNYMIDGSYDLFRCMDLYLYSHTSRTRKSSSGSSGSGSGRRSGGRSGSF